MNNTLNPAEENDAERELAREKRRSESNEEETSGSDEAGSLREEKIKAMRQAKAMELSGSKTGEDEMIKQTSAKVLDFLWGLMASVIGFIVSFFALNAIAFIKAINLNLFGLEKKIKLRLGDKIGIVAMDLLVLVILIIVLGLFLLICNVIQNPLGYIGKGLGMTWDAVKGIFTGGGE